MLHKLALTWLKSLKTELCQRILLPYYCRKADEGGACRLECYVKGAQHVMTEGDTRRVSTIYASQDSKLYYLGSKKTLNISFSIWEQCPKNCIFLKLRMPMYCMWSIIQCCHQWTSKNNSDKEQIILRTKPWNYSRSWTLFRDYFGSKLTSPYQNRKYYPDNPKIQ